MSSKERLDVLLVNRGLADSREKAKAIIMSGNVYVDGQKEDKAGSSFNETVNIEVRGNTLKYVSRGGLKLEAALEAFSLDPRNLVCMDIGASTGGFTDCLLQHGARCVYAVENGHGQLAPSLACDPRVHSYENYHAKNLCADDFPERPMFYTMDVSFISQTVILPALAAMMPAGAKLVSLIKPQFEAGRAYIGARGIVKSEEGHRIACDRVLTSTQALGLTPGKVVPSPITGGDGNREYLVCFTKEH